jgi:hypothetical protein
MSIDDIKDGQRINCHGVNGTIIGKRSTRKRGFVPQTLSAGLPETSRTPVREHAAAPVSPARGNLSA